MIHIKEIDELIKAVSKFPGLGPKSAKRIILKLINNKDEIMKPTIMITQKINFRKSVLLKILQINGVSRVQTFLMDTFIF